jgi:ribonucleoside-diphosphate reductase alpha chain
MEHFLGLRIDRSRDALFDETGLKRLRESYMTEGEASPQERFAFIATKFGSNTEHSQRLYDYASQHWLSWSTPILSFGRSSRGLPISCFLPYIDDSAEGLVNTHSEVNWLSVLGGGIGIGFGIRSADDKSTGVMPHLAHYDRASLAYKQGRTRRGSYAAYLDISHPDIMVFLEMRKPTGDPNMRALNLHHGINIPDTFMQIIERCMVDPKASDDWELIDPASKEVREVVSAKALWQKIITLRMETGEPYLHFIDTSNKHLPEWQRLRGLKVRQSNLCSEITLATDKSRTAVCCLSSTNVEKWDDIVKFGLEQFMRDVAEALDNVLQYFIDHAPDTIARAKFSAYRERSIGVGALGFHAYLQSKMVPFESVIAKSINNDMFKKMRAALDKANMELGAERGSPPDAEGTGLRFSHLMAVAPNASSSIIMGNTSPSVEPFRANAYRQDTMSGAGLNKNKYLDALLRAKKVEDIDEVWSTIIANEGSVQHLDILTDDEKDVFKTSMEIDQRWIIEHAADRQQYIDQAQSINLFFRPDVHIKYLHAVHFLAWKQGLKTLYYCRSEKAAKADKVANKIERKRIEEIDMTALVNNDSCLACEG